MTGGKDPFEKQLNSSATFKSSVLSDKPKREWPERIDYVAKRLTAGDYVFGMQSGGSDFLSDGHDLDKTAREFYLRGIASLTGDLSRGSALPDDFSLGPLLVEFAGVKEGLRDVDREDVPPGEILSRLVMRTVQRQARGDRAAIARQLRTDTETPRELVTELTTAPELATVVADALPKPEDAESLTAELASLDLTTELWNHQLEALALWLYHGRNGYVDMATATGKTVLGLAAVTHAVDSGSLHPADQERLSDIFDTGFPDTDNNRSNDVLIVTTDDLLGVQWARLFQEHCHTPTEFTQVTENGVQLPRLDIDIRSARSLDNVAPSDYRLAIFDEVHNYKSRTGWGADLVDFIESSCPVLALTGSVTDSLESTVERADNPFPVVYRYTHELALEDGVIPDFEWTLQFTDVADSDTLTAFRRTAEQVGRLVTYENSTYRIEKDTLESVAPDLSDEICSEIAGKYATGSALANALRESGSGNEAPTEWLDGVASGLSNRTLDRLNLSTDLNTVTERTESALETGRPVLILTRSYDEAKILWEEIYDGSEERVVKRLEAGQSAEKQASVIQAFDEAETDQKVLIGPGKRIGQGNDIHSIEVGINIAKPGSGVNATLVQRLGRLLRDAENKDTVDFYHVMGVPPEDAIIDSDAESFVRTVSEFFGQVLHPDTDGILKAPNVDLSHGVDNDVAALEHRGVPVLEDNERTTVIESAYAAAIRETPSGTPAVDTDWFSAAFGDTNASPPKPKSKPTQKQTDEQKNTGARLTTLSPLAEHFEAFRSFCIIHRALMDAGLSELDSSDPFVQWAEDARSLLDEDGFGAQAHGYSYQVANSKEIDIETYRDSHGDDQRLTSFKMVDVEQPPSAVLTLLGDQWSKLATWHVPVAPESGTPLPLIVETEAELERARVLLAEFPEEPQVRISSNQTEEEPP